MWRSVGVGVLLAGVLAACSVDQAGNRSFSGAESRPSSSSPPSGSIGRAAYTVTCDQVIGRPKSPFADGYRRVLGVVSVPAKFIPQVVKVSGLGWPYWEKSGIVLRAGRTPVTVSVPRAWRGRAAITWGNGKPAASAIRFAPCPSPPGVWNAYAGGFFLRQHGACVPLVFQVGQQRQRVRFGIDRRCGSHGSPSA
jgi:hypothetical protein